MQITLMSMQKKEKKSEPCSLNSSQPAKRNNQSHERDTKKEERRAGISTSMTIRHLLCYV